MKKFLLNPYFLFFVILLIGIFLRTYQFPNIPPGINQDEAAAAVEAYSLLQTGSDKWGNELPAYFPAWGSGQNVMYSYIMVPFIQIFGLNTFSVRLPALLIGIASIALFYLLLRKIYNTKIALTGMLLFAILPWHIMASRWALESNILPFFFLLGMLGLSYALETSPSKSKSQSIMQRMTIVLSLIPFALAFYAYSLSLFVIPIFLVLMFYFNRKKVLENKKYWIAAFVIFILISIPIGLFILKNNILKSDLGIEQYLPFSIPMFPANRIDQVQGISFAERIGRNLWFFATGLQDDLTWNSAKDYLPLSPFIFIFALVAFIKNILDIRRHKSLNIFVAVLISYFVTVLLVEQNLNRFNVGMLAVIALGAEGIWIVLNSLSKSFEMGKRGKYFMFVSFIALFVGYSIFFSNYYFTKYREDAKDSFNYGVDEAIAYAEKELPSSSKIYLSTSAPINYVYYLFYSKANPSDFQENAFVQVNNGSYDVNQYKNFYFVKDYFLNEIESGDRYYVILKKNDLDFCEEQKNLFVNDYWRVGECNNL